MYIRVKVFTKSKKEKVIQKNEYSYEIHCKEKAEQNKANKSVCKILAKYLNIDEKNIHMISGHQRPQKMFEIKEK